MAVAARVATAPAGRFRTVRVQERVRRTPMPVRLVRKSRSRFVNRKPRTQQRTELQNL